jgi:hypothetical protein
MAGEHRSRWVLDSCHTSVTSCPEAKKYSDWLRNEEAEEGIEGTQSQLIHRRLSIRSRLVERCASSPPPPTPKDRATYYVSRIGSTSNNRGRDGWEMNGWDS